MMKKFFLFFAIILIAVILTACGAKVNMDELSEDGFYHYQNKDLSFAVALPAEFENYHVQSKATDDFVDTEFFTPTADTTYPQEIQSYAKPVVVRIFNQDAWNNLNKENDKAIYEKINEEKGKVYTIKFWDKIPADWQDKWSEEMESGIKDSFAIK